MFRHGKRKLELIPFEANTTRSISLPRDRLIKDIWLKLHCVATVAGASAGAVLEDAVERLVQEVSVVGDGVTTLFRMDGRALRVKNTIELGCPPLNTDPTAATNGTYNVYLLLWIPFGNNMGIRAADTFLLAPAYRTLELRIKWGDPTDMFDAAFNGTCTIPLSSGITPVIEETTEPTPVFLRIQDFTEKIITASQSDFEVDLPVGAKLFQDLMIRTLDADLRDDAILNYINLETGDSYFHLQNIPAAQLQYMNEAQFHLEAVESGYYYLYLLEDFGEFRFDGRINSALQTFDVNTFKEKLDVTVGAGTTKLRTYWDYVTKL